MERTEPSALGRTSKEARLKVVVTQIQQKEINEVSIPTNPD